MAHEEDSLLVDRPFTIGCLLNIVFACLGAFIYLSFVNQTIPRCQQLDAGDRFGMFFVYTPRVLMVYMVVMLVSIITQFISSFLLNWPLWKSLLLNVVSIVITIIVAYNFFVPINVNTASSC